MAAQGSIELLRGNVRRADRRAGRRVDDAKETVTAFLDSIGYDTHDAGPLSESWRFQPDTPAYGQPYVAPGSEFPGPAHRVTAAQLEEKLATAVRA